MIICTVKTDPNTYLKPNLSLKKPNGTLVITFVKDAAEITHVKKLSEKFPTSIPIVF